MITGRTRGDELECLARLVREDYLPLRVKADASSRGPVADFDLILWVHNKLNVFLLFEQLLLLEVVSNIDEY